MISSDVMRGFNDLIILSILMEGDSYGYFISNAIKERTDGRYLMKETTLYSAFSRLEKKELIRAFSSDQTFGKPRTYYTITPLGQSIYADKVREWHEVNQVVNTFIDPQNKEALS